MINILFVASFRISPNSGGVQRVTETLSKEFRNIGNNVYYLSVSEGNDELIGGINQYYLPNGKDYNNKQNIDYFKRILSDKDIRIIINQIGFSKGISHFIKNNSSINIKMISVHHNCLKCLNEQYHNIYENTLKSRGILKLFNNNIGWYCLKKIHKYRLGKEIKETIKISDKVVLLSDNFISDIGYYIKKYDQTKIIGIPNPNPFSNVSFDLKRKENRIIYVGRLNFVQKRVEKLIDIWEGIFLKFPNWEFDIVGDGPARPYLEAEVKNRGLTRINFHGFQNPVPYFKKAKIFVMTSDFEGFGMVLIEAQSFGVVPLAFNCFSSIGEIIDNKKSGYIINEFDLNNYISILSDLMKIDNNLKEMSNNAIKTVQYFNVKNITQTWVETMNKLIYE